MNKRFFFQTKFDSRSYYFVGLLSKNIKNVHMNRTSRGKDRHQFAMLITEMRATVNSYEKCISRLSYRMIKILVSPSYTMIVDIININDHLRTHTIKNDARISHYLRLMFAIVLIHCKASYTIAVNSQRK